MQTYAKVIVVAHLAATPKVVETESGKRIADFSVAVHDVFQRGTETCRTTTYVDWTAFGGFANLVEKLEVGTALLLDGRIANEKWTDRHSQKRFKLKMVVERMRVLSRPGIAADKAEEQPAADISKGQ